MAPIRRGVHRPLEDEANRILKEGLAGVTSHSEKSDVLTPWKEADRRRREVYVASGTPDPSLRRGMYHRASHRGRPDLNSSEGVARPSRSDGLRRFVEDNRRRDDD